MKILVKYPTRGRPQIFLERLKEWYESATNPAEIGWLVSYDANDETMTYSVTSQAQKIIREDSLHCVKGNSRSKIQACNADMNIMEDWPWDVVLLISDDMACRRVGWDDVIRAKMFELYPDTDGCLWFHDGSKQRDICTLSCIGRKYYDKFGYIYHPSFKSFFCDNEFTDVAQKAGKITFIEKGIATHEHPAWGGNMKHDATYKGNNKYWAEDQATYNHRKALGFPS